MHSFKIKHRPFVAQRAYWKFSMERAGGYHIAAVIISLISIIGTIKGNAPWLFGFGAGVCSLYFYNLWTEIHNVGIKAGNKISDLKLENYGFVQEYDGKSSFIPWNEVGVVRNMKGILLLIAKNQLTYVAFPTNDISPIAIAYIETKVLESGGKVFK